MSIFGKLFGRSKPKESGELVFKSTVAALEFELETNPCLNPVTGDLVMGVVLHAWNRNDGNQFAHVVSNVVSESLNEEEVYRSLPGVKESALFSELVELAKGNGKIIANAICADNVPQLQVGDFVAVQLLVVPNGMLLGAIVQAAQPILNPQYGWKSRSAP